MLADVCDLFGKQSVKAIWPSHRIRMHLFGQIGQHLVNLTILSARHIPKPVARWSVSMWKRSMSMHAVSSQYSIVNNIRLVPCIWILHMQWSSCMTIAPCYFCNIFDEPITTVETQNQFQMTQTDVVISPVHIYKLHDLTRLPPVRPESPHILGLLWKKIWTSCLLYFTRMHWQDMTQWHSGGYIMFINHWYG